VSACSHTRCLPPPLPLLAGREGLPSPGEGGVEAVPSVPCPAHAAPVAKRGSCRRSKISISSMEMGLSFGWRELKESRTAVRMVLLRPA
jgi:hypothetical protein